MPARNRSGVATQSDRSAKSEPDRPFQWFLGGQPIYHRGKPCPRASWWLCGLNTFNWEPANVPLLLRSAPLVNKRNRGHGRPGLDNRPPGAKVNSPVARPRPVAPAAA